jgi:hypothetical protein
MSSQAPGRLTQYRYGIAQPSVVHAHVRRGHWLDIRTLNQLDGGVPLDVVDRRVEARSKKEQHGVVYPVNTLKVVQREDALTVMSTFIARQLKRVL